MDKFLSQEEVKVILNNAPKGSNPDKIVEGLVSRGYTLQGLNEPKTLTQQGQEVATGFVKGAGRTLRSAAQGVQDIGQATLGLVSDKAYAPEVGIESLKPETRAGKKLS